MSPEAWLGTHAVVGDEVLSWVNPEHPGYAYPEAAGLLVRWLALQGRPVPPAIVARLEHRVRRDAVGRDGSTYAFDTAVVLTGLEALDDQEDPRWTAARSRLIGAPAVRPDAPPRWSTTWGPHMLKLAVGTAARAARGWSTPLLDSLARLPVAQDHRGGLHDYVHAHAYGTEGLMALRVLGARRDLSLEGAVEFLRALQRDDGGLPGWRHGGRAHADATAQAIRIFILHDRDGHAGAIDRGLSFLDTLTEDHGVVRYAEGSGDRNTWCTLFAAQARAWAAGAPARAEALL